MSAGLTSRRTRDRSLATLSLTVPSIVAVQGPKAGKRFLEFFASTIRNPNTRAAYAHAVGRFLAWSRSIFQAVARFLCWLRSLWHCVTIPVGRCVKRIALLVLLTC